MAYISKITLPSGSEYDIKDAKAWSDIEDLRRSISGGIAFIGITTTPLTDGSTTNPIIINGSSHTAITGNLTIYQKSEFLWDGSKWQQMGDLSSLGTLAYKNSASGSFTPSGTVGQPTFSGTSFNSTGTFTPDGDVTTTLSSGTSSSTGSVEYVSGIGTKSFSGTAATITTTITPSGSVTISSGSSGAVNYTPSGSVTAPTISVKTAGTTTNVNSITNVGTLPTFGATVSSENLTLSFTQGTLPTKSDNISVKTGDAAYEATAPTFNGSGVVLAASFDGEETSGTASYTPAGSITVETTTKYLSASSDFSGTGGTVTVSGTATGTVSQPGFTGTAGTVTVS